VVPEVSKKNKERKILSKGPARSRRLEILENICEQRERTKSDRTPLLRGDIAGPELILERSTEEFGRSSHGGELHRGPIKCNRAYLKENR